MSDNIIITHNFIDTFAKNFFQIENNEEKKSLIISFFIFVFKPFSFKNSEYTFESYQKIYNNMNIFEKNITNKLINMIEKNSKIDPEIEFIIATQLFEYYSLFYSELINEESKNEEKMKIILSEKIKLANFCKKKMNFPFYSSFLVCFSLPNFSEIILSNNTKKIPIWNLSLYYDLKIIQRFLQCCTESDIKKNRENNCSKILKILENGENNFSIIDLVNIYNLAETSFRVLFGEDNPYSFRVSKIKMCIREKLREINEENILSRIEIKPF